MNDRFSWDNMGYAPYANYNRGSIKQCIVYGETCDSVL